MPDTVKALVRAGKLTAGHARALIGQPNAEQLAEDIVARGLNVRQVEAMAREEAKKPGKAAKGAQAAGRMPIRCAGEAPADALGLAVTMIITRVRARCM